MIAKRFISSDLSIQSLISITREYFSKVFLEHDLASGQNELKIKSDIG